MADCVSAWFLDIRLSTEMECTSLLLSKSLLPDLRDAKGTANLLDRTIDDPETPELLLGALLSEKNDDELPHDSAVESDGFMLSANESSQALRLSKEDNSSVDSACGSSTETSARSVWHEAMDDVGEKAASVALAAGLLFLPQFANMKDKLGRILSLGSRVFAHLRDCNRATSHRPMLDAVRYFLDQVASSDCIAFLPYEDIELLRRETEQLYVLQQPGTNVDQFCVAVTTVCVQVFGYFAKVTLRHICECREDDALLTLALDQLARFCLFGRGVCHCAIQAGAVLSLLRLVATRSPYKDETRLALRALAILCSQSKACIQLLSTGGQQLVIRQLCESPFACAIEAAGVLTQLTAPGHCFAALPSTLPAVLGRLLDLSDESADAEQLLLCVACVANLALQHAAVSQHLYAHNAALRLCRAAERAPTDSAFVRDQLATVLARMAANGYADALIAQGAVDWLLGALVQRDARHAALSRRVRYKAAVCLGTIAARGNGLKNIHKINGYDALMEAIRLQKGGQDPATRICANLLSRIESKYDMESLV